MARKKAGRKPYEPTEQDRATVKQMIAGGIDQAAIASVIGVDSKQRRNGIAEKTLRKHFRAEINNGAAFANKLVIKSLLAMATNGKNVAATIYWTKTRMGWQETPQVVQHSGAGGGPIAVVYSWAEAEPKPPQPAQPADVAP